MKNIRSIIANTLVGVVILSILSLISFGIAYYLETIWPILACTMLLIAAHIIGSATQWAFQDKINNIKSKLKAIHELFFKGRIKKP